MRNDWPHVLLALWVDGLDPVFELVEEGALSASGGSRTAVTIFTTSRAERTISSLSTPSKIAISDSCGLLGT